MSVAEILTAAAPFVTAAAGFITALRAKKEAKAADVKAEKATKDAKAADTKATEANGRAEAAMQWADRLANAHQDGVVLVLSYPGTAASCRSLLEVNGWHIQHYAVTQAELDRGALLPGPHVIEDVRVADAVVIEGLDEANMDKLAALRDFRDRIRSGASVVLYTGGQNYRYDLRNWGMCDVACNVPATAEAAVRASIARGEATQRIQGIRPGHLGEARQALLTSR